MKALKKNKKIWSDQAAAHTRKASEMGKLYKTATMVAAMAGLAVLQSCAVPRTDDSLQTASIANDYRARHPVTLAEVENTLDIPIASSDRKLSIGLKDSIAGFAQDYAEGASGTMQLSVPTGSINASAAALLKDDIKKQLTRHGVKSNRIVVTNYAPESADISAPVRLSYIAIKAITNECGKWPKDLINNSTMNENWYNFGCSTQSNMAAMIANPMDLKTPRATTPIDAERRSTVISTYRDGS